MSLQQLDADLLAKTSLAEPLRKMASLMDDLGLDLETAAKVTAWHLTECEGGWATGNRILQDDDLADAISRAWPKAVNEP